MFHSSRPMILRFAAAALLLTVLVLALAPAALAAGTISVDNTNGACVNGSGQTTPYAVVYCKIEDAVADSVGGDTINVAAGTYVLSAAVNLDKDGVTLDGAGAGATVIQVSGMGDRLDISGAGVTVQDFEILKTDKTGEQNIVRIRNNNITIKNNTIHGQFVIGDGEVSRAIVVNAGAFSGINIEGNTIYALRQPAYVSGTHTGMIQNNLVHSTKGWVLEGGDLTFTGNTWGTGTQANVYDIAILGTMPGTYYTDIVAMSAANNDAVIEDQRVSPAVLSVAHVDASTSFATDLGGRYHPYSSITPAIARVVAGGKIRVAPGAYAESPNLNKALKLQGTGWIDFSAPVLTAATAALNTWYTDRYAPAVFESYTFGTRQVLRHGVRAVDSLENRPPPYNSGFYSTQGRKLDTNMVGSKQSMSIDFWLDPSMAGPDGRVAGLWGTAFNASNSVSGYPIVAYRTRAQDPPTYTPVTPGFYGWDVAGANGYMLLRPATPSDYGRWHTLTLVLNVGSNIQYFVDGELLMTLPDTASVSLRNVILNVYNFGQDYDVFWDNFSQNSTVTGQITISASDVEVSGLNITNPGQAYGILIDGAPKPSNVRIANNRIQDLGGASTSAQIKGIYMVNGPDNVTIEGNSFTKIVASSGKSADAINFGDSTSPDASTGVIIRNNDFSNITAGRGAYGVKLNNGAGSPGAQITDNILSGLSGNWTHAIGLEGPTPNAVVTGNKCNALTASGTDNACVFFEKNSGGGSVQVANNQFNGGGYYGVLLHPADLPGGGNGLNYIVNAENNWWNSACGPMGAGAALAGQNVDYSPWYTTATGPDTRTGGANGELLILAGATQAEAQAILSCAGPGSTVLFQGLSYPGGYTVSNNNVTISLNGATIGAGSPAFTIVADDDTILGPGVLDGNNIDPAVLVNAGADNFTLSNVEVKNWLDGVQVAGEVTSLKIVNNFIHNNTDAGLQVDAAPTTGSVVTIEGNLFKANGGNGIESAAALEAEYNSFGHKDGPGSGDGVSALVDADPWTFAETFIDVTPDTLASVRNVDESTSFDVKVLVDAKNLYGFAFKFKYDSTKLLKNSAQAIVPTGYACGALPGLATDEIGYQCAPSTGNPVIDGLVAIGVANFKATGAGLTGNGPWEALFDVDPVASTAGTANGALVYLNNVKLAGIANPRDITDLAPADDGKIVIRGIANFTGFIDVQGRADDSGALLQVYGTSGLTAPVLANATSAKGGGYTTAHTSGNLLTIGTTYYFLVDKPLYVKTVISPAANVPNKVLSTRSLTSLNQLVLKGGDADNSEDVGLNDATCIGGFYGATGGLCGTTGSADVNSDGKVDILDLTLMGGNYGVTASTWAP